MSRSISSSNFMSDTRLRTIEDSAEPTLSRLGPGAYATADYIHDLTGELGQIASEAGLDLLAYLLEMVRIEARMVKFRSKTESVAPDVA